VRAAPNHLMVRSGAIAPRLEPSRSEQHPSRRALRALLRMRPSEVRASPNRLMVRSDASASRLEPSCSAQHPSRRALRALIRMRFSETQSGAKRCVSNHFHQPPHGEERCVSAASRTILLSAASFETRPAGAPQDEVFGGASAQDDFFGKLVLRCESCRKRSKLLAISASFLARDQPLTLRSAAIASTMRSKYSEKTSWTGRRVDV
jgi:hypothetical protein